MVLGWGMRGPMHTGLALGMGFSRCAGVTGMGRHVGTVPHKVPSVRTIPCAQAGIGKDQDAPSTDIPHPSVQGHWGHRHSHTGQVPSPA